MKLVLLLGLLTMVSCRVNTSSNINVNPDDIKIIRKGNLCFAIVASRKTITMATTDLGMAYIPCEKLGDRQ